MECMVEELAAAREVEETVVAMEAVARAGAGPEVVRVGAMAAAREAAWVEVMAVVMVVGTVEATEVALAV